MKMISIYALETAASTAAATAADGTATTANAGLVEMLGMLLPLILMFVVFYFFLIRPQKKKDKKVKDMLAALKPGDRICTIGGIYGTIVKIKDDVLTVEVGEQKTQMVFARWAIRNVEQLSVTNDSEQLI